MGQIELNEGLALHLRKPGDPPLNPTGQRGSPALRANRREIKKALEAELNEPCDRPGFEHLTWWQYGVKNLVQHWADCVPWAVKEVNVRVFGRVPINLNAAFTMRDPGEDLSSLTVAELAERARAIVDATSGVVDGEAVRLVALDGVSSPSGLQPSATMESTLETAPLPDDLPTDPDELRATIALLEAELAALPEEER